MITVIVPGKAYPFELLTTRSEYFRLPFIVTVKSLHTIAAPAIFLATTAPSGNGGDGREPLLSFESDGEMGVVAVLIESPPSSTLTSTSVLLSSQSGESSNEIGCLKAPCFLK
ncbi:hypothetical protein HanRHA438_Chr11g0521861 [Helianthus annuus]|nr:hypothetical protein HanRHA438_Chr11g0521861 [Helianthus annuus]